ncbi:MAG: hypothetical protein Q8Q20_02460 [bacterium]|nr:hypothetical protein [bacterium]
MGERRYAQSLGDQEHIQRDIEDSGNAHDDETAPTISTQKAPDYSSNTPPNPELQPADIESLRRKEAEHTQSGEEFDQLLEYDYYQFARKHRKLDTVFHPVVALRKIRKNPPSERQNALREYKWNLATQRQAWAQCRSFLERAIEHEHDVSGSDLEDIVEWFAADFGFDSEAKNQAYDLIRWYINTRHKVMEVYSEYSNNRELVQVVTGTDPGDDTDLSVSPGPMSIDIVTNQETASRIFNHSENPVTGFKSLGFAATSNDAIPYTVIAWDRHVRKNFQDTESHLADTRRHEHEHVKNSLFLRIFERKYNSDECDKLYRQYRQESDKTVKHELLAPLFSTILEEAYAEVKNEVTASLQERTARELRADAEYMFFREPGGSYDFLEYWKNIKQEQNNTDWQNDTKRLLIQEYAQTVRRALDAVVDLVEAGGYSEKEAVALLTDKKLPEWGKTVARLLDTKNKKRSV